jgi:hypothetical protein
LEEQKPKDVTARLLDLYEVEESNEFIYTNEFYDVYILDDLDIP